MFRFTEPFSGPFLNQVHQASATDASNPNSTFPMRVYVCNVYLFMYACMH